MDTILYQSCHPVFGFPFLFLNWQALHPLRWTPNRPAHCDFLGQGAPLGEPKPQQSDPQTSQREREMSGKHPSLETYPPWNPQKWCKIGDHSSGWLGQSELPRSCSNPSTVIMQSTQQTANIFITWYHENRWNSIMNVNEMWHVCSWWLHDIHAPTCHQKTGWLGLSKRSQSTAGGLFFSTCDLAGTNGHLMWWCSPEKEAKYESKTGQRALVLNPLDFQLSAQAFSSSRPVFNPHKWSHRQPGSGPFFPALHLLDELQVLQVAKIHEQSSSYHPWLKIVPFVSRVNGGCWDPKVVNHTSTFNS